MIEESMNLLLKHGIIEEAAPDHFQLTSIYKEKFKRALKAEMQNKKIKDPYVLALTIVLAKMIPDGFTKKDIIVLMVFHEKELGLIG